MKKLEVWIFIGLLILGISGSIFANTITSLDCDSKKKMLYDGPVTAVPKSFDYKKKIQESNEGRWDYFDSKKKSSIHQIKLADVRYIHYEEHGRPGVFSEDFYLDVDSSTIYFLYASDGKSYRSDFCRMASQRLSSLAHVQLDEVLKQIDFSQWQKEYHAAGVCDGTFWNLHIFLKNGDSLRVYGSNKWPKSPFWKAFLPLFDEIRQSMFKR